MQRFGVRQIFSIIEPVAGYSLVTPGGDRCLGDPAVPIAKADKIRRVPGGTPRYQDLDLIVPTAYEWDRRS
jgi:UDP-glucose 4-epimerase